MAMNIKNEEANRLAHELAAETGESLTHAILVAVKERLDKVRGRGSQGLAERLLEIGKDCAPRLAGVEDHGDLLYGQDGLPK